MNERWQTTMAKYTPSGKQPLEEGAAELTHYFYLGDDIEEDAAKMAPAGRAHECAAWLAQHRRLIAAFALGVACGVALARAR